MPIRFMLAFATYLPALKCVGRLMDMSTVRVENIHTHLAKHKGVALSMADAGREVALPLFIAMLCVLAVFIPSLFMEGAQSRLGPILTTSLAMMAGMLPMALAQLLEWAKAANKQRRWDAR